MVNHAEMCGCSKNRIHGPEWANGSLCTGKPTGKVAENLRISLSRSKIALISTKICPPEECLPLLNFCRLFHKTRKTKFSQNLKRLWNGGEPTEFVGYLMPVSDICQLLDTIRF